jgi:hypothetical protein
MSRLQSYKFQPFDRSGPRLSSRRFKLFDSCSNHTTIKLLHYLKLWAKKLNCSLPTQFFNIAESFLPKNFDHIGKIGNIGTFGDMGTELNFFVQKMKKTRRGSK